jgi:hypothetical protein
MLGAHLCRPAPCAPICTADLARRAWLRDDAERQFGRGSVRSRGREEGSVRAGLVGGEEHARPSGDRPELG